MKVKVCGITNSEDAFAAIEGGADALGFILYNKSKRFIPLERLVEISSQLPPLILKVGVFVNEKPEVINFIAQLANLNAVQLHGNEDISYMEKINYPVLKAFRIDNDFNWDIIQQYERCDVLLDTFNYEYFGGTGKTFDWEMIPPKILNRVILSGGISTENLEHIYINIKPAAIDLSSSLEIAPGIKDKSKIKLFFKKLNELKKETQND